MKQHSVTVLNRKNEDHVQSRNIPPVNTIEDEIRRRAYDLYEKRGRLDGRAMEDWLQAENEIRTARSAAA